MKPIVPIVHLLLLLFLKAGNFTIVQHTYIQTGSSTINAPINVADVYTEDYPYSLPDMFCS